MITELTAEEICIALERLLFDDDLTAKTDEQIDRAIMAWPECEGYRGNLEHSRKGPMWLCEFSFQGNTYDYRWPYKSHPHRWKNRHGQPWQSSIEQHVRDYRRKPRDFTTPDGMMLVLKAMEARKYEFEISTHITREVAFWNPNRDEYECAGVCEIKTISLIPEAVARAAHMALNSEAR